MSENAESSEADALRAEWRRVRRAAVFFACCVFVVLALALVGIYH